MAKLFKTEEWVISMVTMIVLPLLSVFNVTLDIDTILAMIVPIIGYVTGIGLIRYKSVVDDGRSIFYLSKKWWTVTINTILVLVYKISGIKIDPSILYPVMTVVLSYLTSETIRDIKNLPQKEVINDKPDNNS